MTAIMNLELVQQIVALMGEYPVSEITVEQEGRRVCVRKPLTAAVAPMPLMDALEAVTEEAGEPSAILEVAAAEEERRTLTATMVGIFHHADPPIPYAAVIEAGQCIGFIESMKLMNDVLAEAGGRVVEVLVEDGAPVEYGQSLFRLSAVSPEGDF